MILLCGAALWLAWHFRFGRPPATAELAARIQRNGGVLLVIDVERLRSSGVLSLLTRSRVEEEREYRDFVTLTAFDYRTDLDLVVACFHRGSIYAFLKGRFDWSLIKSYVEAEGGVCWNGLCRIRTARRDRVLSFIPMKPNLMLIGIAEDPWSLVTVPPSAPAPPAIPSEPAWISLPSQVLKGNESLPAGSRLFAKALEEADNLTFTLGQSERGLQLALAADCRTPETAATLFNQLLGVTTVVREYLSRLKQTPNPADLSGVLTGGQFELRDRRVIGKWPIERPFLDALAGGNL